jgi:hypothetical protein
MQRITTTDPSHLLPDLVLVLALEVRHVRHAVGRHAHGAHPAGTRVVAMGVRGGGLVAFAVKGKLVRKCEHDYL